MHLRSIQTSSHHITNNPTEDRTSTPFRLNALATLLLPSIVPFTLLVIAPTNNALEAKNEELASASLESKAEGENVHALMDKWATLNLARAGIVAIGALCTVLAALSKREAFEFGGAALRGGADRLG